MSDAPKLKRYFARAMRRAPVSTEALLWKLLRDRRLEGIKFRRQVPIGKYVADFGCFHRRMIIEADGPTHADNLDDPVRDAWLRGQGFRVLRSANDEVHNDKTGTLAKIVRSVRGESG